MSIGNFMVMVAGVALVVYVGALSGLHVGQSMTKQKIADGELMCEMVHEARVCWNPKEDKKK